jgi:hypothetical protein
MTMKCFPKPVSVVRAPDRAGSPVRRAGRAEAAFTLTELALCIAVVGIALVAIVGVLPTGLTVQRQNREDTLVTEDAKFLIETLRNGSLNVADLTNYVEQVTWIRHLPNGTRLTNQFFGLHSQDRGAGDLLILDPIEVVTLLSLPREELMNPGQTPPLFATNVVQAVFRSFGSAFSEKPYLEPGGTRPAPSRLDTAFRYRVTVSSRPTSARPVFLAQSGTNTVERSLQQRQQMLMEGSLHEMVLQFQWPVYRVGNEWRTGNNQRVFRTQVHGRRQQVVTRFSQMGSPMTRFMPGGTEFVSDAAW